MGSSAEFKRWLLVYVRRLSVDGDEGRLREVLKGLIDPKDPMANALGVNGDKTMILGHHRASLFSEMIREALRNKSSLPIQDLAQELMDVHADIMGGGVSWRGLGQEEGTSRGKKRQAEQ
jgi:hypothetical protein